MKACFRANVIAGQECVGPAQSLLAAISEMGAFAAPSDLLTEQVLLGEAAQTAQQPLLAAGLLPSRHITFSRRILTSLGKVVVQHSCALVTTAKALVANPKDPQQWQQLAANSKAVSDSIKGLVG